MSVAIVEVLKNAGITDESFLDWSRAFGSDWAAAWGAVRNFERAWVLARVSGRVSEDEMMSALRYALGPRGLAAAEALPPNRAANRQEMRAVMDYYYPPETHDAAYDEVVTRLRHALQDAFNDA